MSSVLDRHSRVAPNKIIAAHGSEAVSYPTHQSRTSTKLMSNIATLSLLNLFRGYFDTAFLGSVELDNPSPYHVEIPVKDVYTHISTMDPTSTLNADLALIRLANPVQLNDYVNLACLPDANFTVPSDTKCYIVGWGYQQEDGM